MTSVQDKVVFITGGARGIGAEVARRLHNMGAKLVLTDLSEAELATIAAELGGDDRVLTVVADVRDLPAMGAAADQAVEKFGGIDIVMANAGIASYGSVLQVDRRSSSGCSTSTLWVSFTPCVPPCRRSSNAAATC